VTWSVPSSDEWRRERCGKWGNGETGQGVREMRETGEGNEGDGTANGVPLEG
jgi:hypothetical protein